MRDLSVLIASRNEEFLKVTIDNVLAQMRGDTEVIAVLDGGWANPPIPDHPRVRLVYEPSPIGQRAAVNVAARLSSARYVMKLDAHCAVDEGFDVKLMAPYELAELGPDVTTIPAMINLHAFNWRCRACGRETYQGPKPVTCGDRVDNELAQAPQPCGSTKGFERVMVWEPRHRKGKGNGSRGEGGLMRTEFWRFDHDLHFQYRGPVVTGQEKAEIADVMSSLGACFFMRRDRLWRLGGMDEAHGSWGQFGTEIACKTWLSGGRQVVNRRTWFAHMFRTQGAGFGFPYEIRPTDQERARLYSQRLWLTNGWSGQVRPLSWLIDHFRPIRDWHDSSGAERLADVKRAGEEFYSRRKVA